MRFPEVAKALDTGKAVRRDNAWSPEAYMALEKIRAGHTYKVELVIYAANPRDDKKMDRRVVSLPGSDLIADDWEVVDEQDTGD